MHTTVITAFDIKSLPSRENENHIGSISKTCVARRFRDDLWHRVPMTANIEKSLSFYIADMKETNDKCKPSTRRRTQFVTGKKSDRENLMWQLYGAQCARSIID
jgi:hypothetical protein